MPRSSTWVGAVAVILAATLGICLASIVIGVLVGDVDLTATARAALSAFLGGILGCLTTYVAVTTYHKENRRDEDR